MVSTLQVTYTVHNELLGHFVRTHLGVLTFSAHSSTVCDPSRPLIVTMVMSFVSLHFMGFLYSALLNLLMITVWSSHAGNCHLLRSGPLVFKILALRQCCLLGSLSKINRGGKAPQATNLQVSVQWLLSLCRLHSQAIVHKVARSC